MTKRKDRIDPQIVKVVLERSEELCEYNNCTMMDRNQLHHIIHGRGKRKPCETEQSVICLCFYHHYSHDCGVHGKNGHNTDIEQKLQLQDRYRSMGKGEAEIRRLMGGKLYSEDDYIGK